MQEALDSVVIVLYQPQDVVNVAAILRVMSNFGLRHLRLVEPAAFDPYRIVGIAHHTEELVERVERYERLADALADTVYVLGTTGRPRQTEPLLLTPRAAAPLLLATGAANPGGKVALLFGREQDGLPNEALDLCHGVVAIPTHPANRSLNLAQAALVLAYELWTTATASAAATDPAALQAKDLADGPRRDAMFASLELLLTTLYPGTSGQRLTNAMSRMRTLLMRAVPRQAEAEAFTRLCRHAARLLAAQNAIDETEGPE